MGGGGICEQLTHARPIGQVGLFSFVFLVIQVLSTLGILGWLWRSRVLAEKGLESAARVLLLPLYSWILWVFALTILAQAIVTLFFPMRVELFDFESASLNYSFLYAFLWSAYHFVIEGITFLLLLPGAGIRDQRKAFACALLWACVTFFVHLFSIHPPDKKTSFALQIAWEGLLGTFYLFMRFLPQRTLFRRPAIYGYATFWALFRFSNVASIALQYYRYELGTCVYVFSYWCMFGIAKPFVVYTVLLRDSLYWRGIFVHEARSIHSAPSKIAHILSRARDSFKATISSSGREEDIITIEEQKTQGKNASLSASYYRDDRTISYDVMSPLLGQQLDPGTAQHIAQNMDFSSVRVVNFAFLSLGRTYKILGAGGTSRVYQGKLKGVPVAIKMVYRMDLTPQVVQNFYDEAAVLTSLQHQNIVDIIGVTVIPPSLCIVMELCQGSVYEFIHGAFRGASPPGINPTAAIDMRERLSMAIECARGVAHLHSQKLLHTDIKSLNFLINRDGIVKLCDFEHCIRLHITQSASGNNKNKSSNSPTAADADGFYRVPVSVLDEEKRGIPDTLNWLAPEIVRGAYYTKGSDVYSLAIVVWELVTGQIPFGRLSQANVRNVLLGEHYHPPLFDLPPALSALFLACWQPEPHKRPAADAVVHMLIQLESNLP